VAAEVAAPLSHAKKLTMVSGGSSEVGVSKITTEVLQVVERLPKMVEGVTGVDIAKVMSVLHMSIQLSVTSRCSRNC